MRLGNFLEMPLLGLSADDAVRLIQLFLGGDIEPVVVEEVHCSDVLAVDDRNGVGAAQPNEKRDQAHSGRLLAPETLRRNDVSKRGRGSPACRATES